MNHKPIAVFVPAPLRHDEWKRRFTLNWIDSEPAVITHLYSEDLVRQQQAEIEALETELSEWKSEPLVKLLKETNYVNVVATRK